LYNIKLELAKDDFGASFDDVIEVVIQAAEYDRYAVKGYLEDAIRDRDTKEIAAEWILANERSYQIGSKLVRAAERILEEK